MSRAFKLRLNPIVIKELRSRMRGPRAFIILTAFLLVLGLFTYGLYRMLTFTQNIGMGGAPMGAVVGRSIFVGLAFFELLLVCLITPALTAGAISGEAERRTLDMLLATPLRPAAVLGGKLISALTYVFLLIVAAVPLVSIVFILGGVTFSDMARALGMVVLCAVTFGTLGLCASAAIRRTGRAMVLSYAILLLLMGGTYFAYVVLAVIGQGNAPRWLLLANPVAAMASAAGGDVGPEALAGSGTLGSLTPLLWILGGSPLRGVMGGPVDASSGVQTLRPLWHYTAGLYLLATLVLNVLAVQALRPIRRWRVGRTGTIAAIGAALLIVALAYGFYGPPSYGRFGYPALAAPTPGPAGVFMERGLSSVAVAVAAPAVPMPVGPQPTATPIPATGLAPQQLGTAYAAVAVWLLQRAPARDGEVRIADTAGGGLLAALSIDSAEPVALAPEVLAAVMQAVKTQHPAGAAPVHPADVAAEEKLAGEGTLVRFGVPVPQDGGRVFVAVARYDSPNDASARVLSLELKGDAWAVVDVGEELKR